MRKLSKLSQPLTKNIRATENTSQFTKNIWWIRKVKK